MISLSEWDSVNAQAAQYSASLVPYISKLCEPLQKNFGISFFIYQNYFNDGHYLSLTNNEDIGLYYHQYIEGLSSTFQSAISKTIKNNFYYFLWPTAMNSLDISQERILSKTHSSNIWNGVSIYRRGVDFVESWSFASDINNPSVIDFYMNKRSVLNHFILYFNERVSHLIIRPKQNVLALFRNLPQLFSAKQQHLSTVGAFFEDTPLQRALFVHAEGEANFSVRELSCIRYILEGKTAKEIGKILGLSPRTVEFYISNVKKKITNSQGESLLKIIIKNTFFVEAILGDIADSA